MKNELDRVGSTNGYLSERGVSSDFTEAKQFGGKLYITGLMYTESLEIPSLSKFNDDYHKDLLVCANNVKLLRRPDVAIRTFLKRVRKAIRGSEEKKNNLNPDALKVMVSEVWDQIEDLALNSGKS